jgi:hypothetical protein
MTRRFREEDATWRAAPAGKSVAAAPGAELSQRDNCYLGLTPRDNYYQKPDSPGRR